MLNGFDHLTLAVPQLAPAQAAFGALFGLAPSFIGGHPELGTEAALFGLANGTLELVAPAPRDPEGLAEGLRALTAHGGVLQAIAFSTADAEALSSALRERGVRATRPQPGQALDQAGNVARSYRTVELSPKAARGLGVLAVERQAPLPPSPELERDPSSVHALDHVVVRSADLDATRALYGEQLGIRLALERELAGTRMQFFRIGGVTLEVVQDASAGERDVLWGAAFRVRDIEAAHARMTGSGIVASEIRDGRKAGTRVFNVKGGVCGVPVLVIFDPARG